MRVAVIGAGIAGLACADALAAAGNAVTLFDKGRAPGGRMSTRRVEADADADRRTLRFDHGAQYFTARDAGFVDQVLRWEADGAAARWPIAGEDAWVGTPGMNSPARDLAARLDVVSGVRIDALRRADDGWRLEGADGRGADGGRAEGRGPFDAALVAVPAEQAAPLLRPLHPGFAEVAARVRSDPCWTVMAAFAERIATDRTVVRDAGAIGWAARDSDKPGRSEAECWVVQANADWSARHLEDAPDAVAPVLLAMLFAELGIREAAPTYLSAHRWRYARSGRAGGGADGTGALWDASLGLGACGDWLIAPRVEAAWRSGRRLAERMATG